MFMLLGLFYWKIRMDKTSEPDYYYWNLIDNMNINGLIGITSFELTELVVSGTY